MACAFRNITKIPCPGCGLTRAYLSLLKGDIKQAFIYHPLFWIIPFILVIIFGKFKYKNKILISIIILFIIVYIYRMINNSIL